MSEQRKRPDCWLLVSRFLTPRAQLLLEKAGWSYADAAGNVRIEMVQPAVFIRITGESRDRDSEPRPIRTLRGSVAGRLVRALAEFRPPLGIVELAERAGTSPAMASRVAALLTSEAIIQRNENGQIREVDWRAMLTRWAEEYDFNRSNRVVRFLALRGKKALLEALRRSQSRYAITGAAAAEFMKTVASSPITAIYTTDVPGFARELGLERTQTPTNVLLVEPYDDVVFDRTWTQEGLTLAAPSQIAVDLLTSGDRNPQIAEAALEWMEENNASWRS